VLAAGVTLVSLFALHGMRHLSHWMKDRAE
jgi:hypothetical protein